MRLTVFSVLAVLALAGCGIKPSHVDPPQGEANDRFPRVYPAPAPSAPPPVEEPAPPAPDPANAVPQFTPSTEEDLP